MSEAGPSENVPIHPAATVVVLRDASEGFEVLLLQRVSRKAEGGPWVFPGGKVEAVDRGPEDVDEAELARRAAVRETREESALELSLDALVPLSRWITPELAPRRFDTWFFGGRADAAGQVRVDGAEIRDHSWLTPASALDHYGSGRLRLAPPTYVTLHWLLEFRTAAQALSELPQRPFLTFRPRLGNVEGTGCMLYPGDAGYETLEPLRPGPRHRLWVEKSGFRYERSSR